MLMLVFIPIVVLSCTVIAPIFNSLVQESTHRYGDLHDWFGGLLKVEMLNSMMLEQFTERMFQ